MADIPGSFVWLIGLPAVVALAVILNLPGRPPAEAGPLTLNRFAALSASAVLPRLNAEAIRRLRAGEDLPAPLQQFHLAYTFAGTWREVGLFDLLARTKTADQPAPDLAAIATAFAAVGSPATDLLRQAARLATGAGAPAIAARAAQLAGSATETPIVNPFAALDASLGPALDDADHRWQACARPIATAVLSSE